MYIYIYFAAVYYLRLWDRLTRNLVFLAEPKLSCEICKVLNMGLDSDKLILGSLNT